VKDLLMKENFKATIDQSSFKTAEVEHIPNIPSPPKEKQKLKKNKNPIRHLAN
jgi:hypothetical protein